ncbi:hypothetical protein SJI00_02200 [Pseudomonas sp. RP23018S]|uniref:hypothetical protein n=1 Tax=Pseudomonas sp. RP23018S TaxID=3096037 RepID=UPI002ACA5B27|nr:hypothetical protein [Pseudomonas sp. RP23018S]MDZ5601592.1 hypothetical protein [Pseudomonas sp. RP23018S]
MNTTTAGVQSQYIFGVPQPKASSKITKRKILPSPRARHSKKRREKQGERKISWHHI